MPFSARLATRFLRGAWLLFVLLSLAGCLAGGRRPDLQRLYADLPADPHQPPIIILHGLMGSTLVDADTGKEYWPGSLGAVALSNYRELNRLNDRDPSAPRLKPGKLFTGIAGVDFYARLIEALEQVGHFHRGTPGEPAKAGERRYYLMLYDWRRDNLFAVRQLHELIEQIRRDYADPGLRVDLVAHSNGGIVANYYLRYGPCDVLDDPTLPTWDEGPKRVRRLVRLGTPQLGAVTSLERLMVGMRLAVRTIPVEVLASFATPIAALPAPELEPIVDSGGHPVTIDLYDPETWRSRRWGVYSPEVMTRVSESAELPGEADRLLADLQSLFDRYLRRAGRYHAALAKPLPGAGVEEAVFGGDCKPTLAHAVLEASAEGEHLAFRTGELLQKVDGMDYDTLFAEPGDGLVTRRSQVGRRGPSLPATAQTFFLCEDHSRLTANPYFQNNLLYFLLAR